VIGTESACLAGLGLPLYTLPPRDQLDRRGHDQVYHNILGLTRRRGREPERLVPKIERDFVLVFCRIRLVLILKSNEIVVKKALVRLCKRLKGLPNNTKIIKKEYKVVLVVCISCR
jgi:hypothetical protein